MIILLSACMATGLPSQSLPEPSTRDTPETDTLPGDTSGEGGGQDSAANGEWHIDIGPIPAALQTEMAGTTMHDGCPVGMDELVLMELAHWDLDGQVQTGRLIVASTVAADLAQVFETLFAQGFPIRAMQPASTYGGSDDASMAADNTSAFNCRPVTGGTGWSQHSYGDAIDINPRENPYISGTTVLPPEGAAYTNREDVRPGMIVEGDAVTEAFDRIGWGWGGRWSSLKDYQHFSSNGQ